MTIRRRSNKRNRNKSSPQTDSSPKTHRINIEEVKTSVSVQELVEDSLQSEQSEHSDTAGVGKNYHIMQISDCKIPPIKCGPTHFTNSVSLSLHSLHPTHFYTENWDL